MGVQPVKRSGKKTLYGAAAKAYRKAHGTVKRAKSKATKTYKRAKSSRGGQMLGSTFAGIDPMAIGLVGVGRKQVAPYGKRFGAMLTDDAAIQDEIGLVMGSLLAPMLMPTLKHGMAGKVRKVLIDHDGVRLVAYYSGQGGEAKGSASFPAGGTGLW